MVPDHGFARVGTMQVQAITPPLISERARNRIRIRTRVAATAVHSGHCDIYTGPLLRLVDFYRFSLPSPGQFFTICPNPKLLRK